MFKRVFTLFVLILVVVVAFLFLFAYQQTKEDAKVVYVPITPEPTVNVTEEAQVTPTPIYVIQVTPEPTEEPTKRPNVILITRRPAQVVTCEPTVEPTPVVTEAPTQVPTSVVTATPIVTSTPVATETPTIEPTTIPTAVPTTEPTVVPTEIPTAVPTTEPTVVPTEIPTAEPTIVPTVAPTEDMNSYYAKIEKEMSTVASPRGGLYYDYETAPQYDLYDYIEVDNLDSNVLFDLLKKPFENGIAIWADMEFVAGDDAVNILSFALQSSICDSCGRVVMRSNPNGNNQISAIFDEIVQNGDCAKANQVLLDYLYKYTVRTDSIHERLFITCNH